VLLVIGSSLAVYPTASLVTDAPPEIPVIVVSLEIEYEMEDAVLIQEKAVTAIPKLVHHWLEKREIDLAGF
jgi:NAD-dependent SIR2 family protein deacetylase